MTPPAASPEPAAGGSWKLLASGIALFTLALTWLVWRRKVKTAQRAAREQRNTQFHLSAIDPSVANNYVAAWERGLAIMPTAIAPPTGAPSSRRAPSAEPEPTSYPGQPAVAVHGYGPYGRVTALRGSAVTPHTAVTVPYHPAQMPYTPAPAAPAACDQPYVPPKPQYPAGAFVLPTPEAQAEPPPNWAVPVVRDDSTTMPDVVNYQAQLERQYAMQLARGSQPEELERTRLWLAMQSMPANPPEPAAVRATRLRHPPVPKPPYLAMLLHMPNRLS